MRLALLMLGLLFLAGCGTPVQVTLIPQGTNAANINTGSVQSGGLTPTALVGSTWQLVSTTNPAPQYTALGAASPFVTTFQSGGTGSMQSASGTTAFDWSSTQSTITTSYFAESNGSVTSVITSYDYAIAAASLTLTDTATGYVYSYTPYSASK